MSRNDYNYLLKDITVLKGVGKKTLELLKKKKIKTLFDVLWNLPYEFIDRSNFVEIKKLEIGKICTIKVKIIKYSFPRKRNLPNKISCEDLSGKIDIVFFNSREGYIRKILPLEKYVIISGKINYYKNKYQITNPKYVLPLEKENLFQKVTAKYSLTEGITENIYKRIIDQILKNIPNIAEWHNLEVLKENKFEDWKTSILKLHNPRIKQDFNSLHYRRLAYDEIFAHLFVLSQIRKKIKKIGKTKKIFKNIFCESIKNNLNFHLTQNQEKIIKEINKDFSSEYKMFRILQGDVGSGKTIISLITACNVIESGYQVAFMAPTEILANQHFQLAKKIFSGLKINFKLLTGKTDSSEKKEILNNLKKNKINLIFGTHALFQKKTEFNKLGFIIIDEQHKFGVKQRMALSKKGGKNCDILLMSATPIPRTLMLTVFGDMDVSRLLEKPSNRKDVITLSKPEAKIHEIIDYIKKEIKNKNQIFWVCPLIDESKKLDYQSAKIKYDYLNNIFPENVGLIHGALKKEERESVLIKFLKKKISILVSTTVIEVGIDFPNANIIIIENSNKFGLSQLHQLRGRVGRSDKQGVCILLFKKNLSENAKERLKILKSTNDGFKISEEDMKLRGFGDLLGYKQSGIKDFRLADPIHHEDLFSFAEKNIKKIELNKKNLEKFKPLLKLYDRANIIEEIGS